MGVWSVSKNEVYLIGKYGLSTNRAKCKKKTWLFHVILLIKLLIWLLFSLKYTLARMFVQSTLENTCITEQVSSAHLHQNVFLIRNTSGARGKTKEGHVWL
jgi:hypothetical protein